MLVPAPQKLPAGHKPLQLLEVIPDVAPKFPARQSAGMLVPTPQKLPAGHGPLQLLDVIPEVAPKVPAGHGPVQLDALKPCVDP